MEQLSLLRATTQRLNSTPVEDLPRVVGFLSFSIASCSALLRKSEPKTTEASIPIHRLKTRVSSLLQDKSAAGRLTAAVLVKSLVEHGTPSDGGLWESWARALLVCLNKSDPYETRKIYLSSLVRIFSLSNKYPSLQREITTPLLPPFIMACLNLVKPVTISNGGQSKSVINPLLPIVLNCWGELLQNNGTTFRPFESRIKAISLSILSDDASSKRLLEAAAHIIASLHNCATKGTGATEWERTFSNLIRAAHTAADRAFRAVQEDWIPSDNAKQTKVLIQDYSKVVEDPTPDVAGLSAWKGVQQGLFRITSLLTLLQTLLGHRIHSVAVPVGEVMDLTSRLLALIVPTNTKAEQYSLKLHPEVERDEKDQLWAQLPYLHVETMKLLSSLMENIGQGILPVCRDLGGQIMDLFNAESWHEDVRAQTYSSTIILLRVSGFAGSQVDRNYIFSLCGSCCKDLSSSIVTNDEPAPMEILSNGKKSDKQSSLAAAQTLSQQTSQDSKALSGRESLVTAASKLLPLLIEYGSSNGLPLSLRTEMDRISILTNNENAMLASVMNPVQSPFGQRTTPSILPFLARLSSGDASVEALLRPRMPVRYDDAQKQTTGAKDVSAEDKLDWDDEGEEEELSDQQAFIGQLHPKIQHRDGSRNDLNLQENPNPQEIVKEQVQFKRDFAAMEDNGTVQGDEMISEGHEDATKRVRVDKVATGSSYHAPAQESVIGTNVEEELAGAAVSISSSSHFGSLDQVVQNLKSNETVQVLDVGVPWSKPIEDSDSDDEIPEINPEPATDSENEDDMDEG